MKTKKWILQAHENVRAVIQMTYRNMLFCFQKNVQSLGKLREKRMTLDIAYSKSYEFFPRATVKILHVELRCKLTERVKLN